MMFPAALALLWRVRDAFDAEGKQADQPQLLTVAITILRARAQHCTLGSGSS